VDGKFSALERAFQLTRSGRIATVDDIKKQLRHEGYDVSSVFWPVTQIAIEKSD
jgi:hypothetical protein